MHDLRRQALESKKTVSRKAQSREASRAASRSQSAQNSRQNSRQSSRNVSRHPSPDDDDDSQSDTTAWSTTSLDDYFDNNNEDASPEPTQGELESLVEEIIERKRSSVEGREQALGAYVRVLSTHYIEEGLETRFNDLLAAFAKSIKMESSERETILALKAVALTAITLNGDDVYEHMHTLVKRTVTDSTSPDVKTAAIRCLAACAFFGGMDDEGLLEEMAFFMEIVSSDGNYVDAADDVGVVTAALEEYGFLASEVDDLEDESEDAIEAFAEQLESSASSVQVAAGENIALLYEKSYTPQEEGETLSDDEMDLSDDEGPSDDDENDGPRLIKRYNAYHNTHRIINQIDALAHISGRHIGRKSKRSLHSNFTSILNTIENPRHGPQYSKAIDNETNRHYGSRKSVKIRQDSSMQLDRWWKWVRLAALRRLLQGGFVAHYFEGNRAVLDCLPVIMREGGSSSSQAQWSRKEGKTSRKGGRVKGAEMF